MVDILRTAVTGLMAFRTSMATTGHNISNINTPYYSRQRVELGASTPEKYPYGYMGTGVDIKSVTRAIDEFTMKQLRGHNSGVGQYDQLNGLTSQLSTLLGDTEVGLTPDLEAFFGSLQDLADSPASIPARQVFLDEASTLTTRIEDINSSLTGLRDSMNTGIRNAVTTINDLTAGIAKINQDISIRQSTPGSEPNDLLDNRDRMLVDLSRLVGAQTLTASDGSFNVFMSNGQPLVVGNTAFKLEAVQSGFDLQEITVRLEGQAKGSDLEPYITSGELGGYFEFRRTILSPAQDGLGLLAMGLAETFNEQHQRGMDLNGGLGTSLFSVGSPKVLSHSTNDGKALFSAELNNSNGPYELMYDGTNYKLTRLSDNVVVRDNFNLDSEITIDGITIEKGTVGTLAANDRFLLKPTVQGAASSATSTPYNGNTSTTTFNTRAIAATDSSQLVRSDYEILVSGVDSRASYINQGNATISAPTIIDATNERLTNNVKIEFVTAATYKVVDATTNQRLDGGVDQAYVSGNTIPPTGSYNGWSVKITDGSPPIAIAAGDTFEISAGYTVKRMSDNQEILKGGDFTDVNNTLRGQGLHLNLTDTPPGSPPRYEDRFLIQPTRNAAPSFALNITDPRKVAAAAPITTTAWPDNVGSTTITAGTVVDAKNLNLQNTVRIQFTSASGYQIQDLSRVPPTTTTGLVYTSGEPITYNGWSMNLTGSPRGVSASALTPNFASSGGVSVSARPTNTGSAGITGINITDGYHIDLVNKVEIRFTSATQYDVFDVTKGTTLASNQTYASGGTTFSHNGWQVTTSGAAKTGDVFQIKNDGDVFVIKNNQGGYGDNRNALELVKLETKQQFMGGNDYRGVYNQIIAEVGAQGRRVENGLQSQEALFEQSTLARESISGVNLDEEAADLVRFQQAYEASAQMIQVANTLFNTLLSAVRS